MDKLKAFWNSLPHAVQAAGVTFVAAAGTALLDQLGQGSCFTLACLKHSGAAAIGAGMVALRAFYMTPNK